MPSDDLILNVRQIGNYPPTADAFPGDLIVLQRGGIGGPFLSITAQDFVATALAQGGGPLDVSTGFAPADAVAPQIFTDNLVVSLGATHNWNCYFPSTGSAFKYTTNGAAAAFGYDGNSGFQWSSAPPGAAGETVALGELMQLRPNGQLILLEGQINLPRDPMAPTEVATAGWVAANTVASFNGRTGPVTLGTWDILYAGGAPIWSPNFGGTPCAPTPEPSSNSTRIATTAFVDTAINEFLSGFLASEVFVASFNGRTGVVVLTAADVTALGLPYAPIDSPNFTGYATSITPPPGTIDGQIATTAFVMAAVAASVAGVVSFNGRTGVVVLSPGDLSAVGGALLGSPTFTGTPAGPTAAPGTNTTQLATTAFVSAATGGGNFAPLNSPAFTGVPTGPTAAVGNDTTQLATTEFVMNAINAVNAGVISFNGRTGAITLLANDISAAGGATLISPIFTGSPTAPTAVVGDATLQIANTAFVTSAIGALPPVPLPSTTPPLVDGPATPGTSVAYARGDHVHPTDTSRYAASNPSGFQTAAQVAAAVAPKFNSSGGLITGGVLINGTLAAQFGTFNLSTSAGGSTPVIQLMNAANTLLAAWSASTPDGTVSLTAPIVAAAITMSGDINLQPGSGHNLLLSPGVGLQSGGGPWAALSDERIKTVEGDYTQGLDAVLALHPVVYRYKGNDRVREDGPSPHAWATDQTFVGLIAQEVEIPMPEMVTLRSGYIDGEAVDDLRTLHVGPLTFALVNAVKQLAARVATLEAAAA